MSAADFVLWLAREDTRTALKMVALLLMAILIYAKLYRMARAQDAPRSRVQLVEMDVYHDDDAPEGGEPRNAA